MEPMAKFNFAQIFLCNWIAYMIIRFKFLWFLQKKPLEKYESDRWLNSFTPIIWVFIGHDVQIVFRTQ